MKYTIVTTRQFDKDLKRCKKRSLPLQKLFDVVNKLSMGMPLEPKHKVHKLSGNHEGQWECHIMPDWLLVWEIHEGELKLLLVRTGTHSDLF